jgi:hypothetical protein
MAWFPDQNKNLKTSSFHPPQKKKPSYWETGQFPAEWGGDPKRSNLTIFFVAKFSSNVLCPAPDDTSHMPQPSNPLTGTKGSAEGSPGRSSWRTPSAGWCAPAASPSSGGRRSRSGRMSRGPRCCSARCRGPGGWRREAP